MSQPSESTFNFNSRPEGKLRVPIVRLFDHYNHRPADRSPCGQRVLRSTGFSNEFESKGGLTAPMVLTRQGLRSVGVITSRYYLPFSSTQGATEPIKGEAESGSACDLLSPLAIMRNWLSVQKNRAM